MPSPCAPALLVAALIAGGVSACAAETPAPAAPAAAPEAPKPAPQEVPFTYVHPDPVLFFETIEGAEATRTHAAFAPVTKALNQCRPGTGGVIRLKLVAGADKSHYDVHPSTSLDPTARRCVLETLSTVDIDGIWSNGSPSEKPPGFTTQFRVEW
jgi:hypothetical protein